MEEQNISGFFSKLHLVMHLFIMSIVFAFLTGRLVDRFQDSLNGFIVQKQGFVGIKTIQLAKVLRNRRRIKSVAWGLSGSEHPDYRKVHKCYSVPVDSL